MKENKLSYTFESSVNSQGQQTVKQNKNSRGVFESSVNSQGKQTKMADVLAQIRVSINCGIDV